MQEEFTFGKNAPPQASQYPPISSFSQAFTEYLGVIHQRLGQGNRDEINHSQIHQVFTKHNALALQKQMAGKRAIKTNPCEISQAGSCFLFLHTHALRLCEDTARRQFSASRKESLQILIPLDFDLYV